jgi:cobyrinic acid a,c-diamide synthase
MMASSDGERTADGQHSISKMEGPTHPRLVIAGTHSGVGKTTVTVALLAALKDRGRSVQAFKAGPDFIDPTHHRMVTGRPSRNLDGWMLGECANRDIFARAATGADISIIEGMMGLFDGSSAVNDVGSTAELAKQIGAPVLLVIDAAAMARSAAALARGYANFDAKLRVAGVLFNRVGSKGHYRLLKDAVEAETALTVVGYVKSDPSVTIPDRHLGLVTALEQGPSELYRRLAAAVRDTVDLDRVEALARSAGVLPWIPETGSPLGAERTVRIGLAHDPAFCFYYPDNLDLLQAEGAELVPFSPIADRCLPNVDMLYLGGGYPELHGERLATNVAMREAVRSFAERGGVIYAECGGLMYLTQAIRDFDGRSHEMVGIFSAEAVMQKSSMTLGYRTIRCSSDCLLGEAGLHARGHEFHYSKLVPTGHLEYICSLSDAQGLSKGADGLVKGNVLALYSHLHFVSQPRIATSLVAAARQAWSRTSASTGG